MSEQSIPAVRRAWWSAAGAALGSEVNITAALDPRADDAEAEVSVEACYVAGADTGGGYVVVPVATLRAPVPAGAAYVRVPWTVAFPAEEPDAVGIPELRARVSVAGGPAAATEMLSVGAVEGVRWVPPDGGELPGPRYGAVVQAVFVPGEQVGMRVDARGLAGFIADFTIRRGDEAVDAVTDVPLGADGVTAWWPSGAVEPGTGAYSFDVSLRHPAVAYAVRQGKGKGKGAGQGSGKGQSKQACAVKKRPTLHWVTNPPSPKDISIDLNCEMLTVTLKAEAKQIYTDGCITDISDQIVWLRYPRKPQKQIDQELAAWRAAGKRGARPDEYYEMVAHTGPDYTYSRPAEEGYVVRIRFSEEVQKQGYPTQRSCLLNPVCKPWTEREQRARDALKKYGVTKNTYIDDPFSNLLVMSAIIMNEMSDKGTDLERECIAYVMLNRARVGWNGKKTIHDVVFDNDPKHPQIYSAIGKSEGFEQYNQVPTPDDANPTPVGPKLCPECLAYGRTIEAVAKVLGDPRSEKEYWLAQRGPREAHRHAYYWFKDGEPAPGADIDYQEPSDFVHSFWGSDKYL